MVTVKNPLVSIVIPVYNGANYLAEAIDSALNQTYNNIEIIVVNDGSTDNGATEEVALSYGDKIRYFCKQNGGVSSALNFGISKMNGEYFSWLSHDDLYLPNKIEVQVSLRQTDKDIIICPGLLIDSNGKDIFTLKKSINRRVSGPELFRLYINKISLNGLGFLIPKTAFDNEGLFDESMRYLQDIDMWFRFMWGDYIFVCHDDFLVKNRVHRNQVTNLHSDLFKIDQKALSDKHVKALKNLTGPNVIPLAKCYMLQFSKSNNKKAVSVLREILRSNGCFDNMIVPCLYYRAKYMIKNKLRFLRDKLYSVRGLRS